MHVKNYICITSLIARLEATHMFIFRKLVKHMRGICVKEYCATVKQQGIAQYTDPVFY